VRREKACLAIRRNSRFFNECDVRAQNCSTFAVENESKFTGKDFAAAIPIYMPREMRNNPGGEASMWYAGWSHTPKLSVDEVMTSRQIDFDELFFS